MKGRFAKETAKAGSQRLWMCPLVDTEQRGQEMVFKRYLGEKTDLTKDQMAGKGKVLAWWDEVNGGAIPRTGSLRKGICKEGNKCKEGNHDSIEI